MLPIKSTFITIILSVFCSVCISQTIINPENTYYKNLGKSIAYIEDVNKNLTFNEVENLREQAFKLGKNDIFNGGTEGKVWWLKLKYIDNKNNTPYLIFDYGNIDNIDIYYRDTLRNIKHISSGTFSKSDSRAFLSAEYVFKLPDVGGHIKHIYIRAHAVNTLILPIKLTTDNILASSILPKYIWELFYTGIAISLLLFNLFMLVSTKDRLYGLYVIRIFFLFCIYVVAYLNGYANFLDKHLSQLILIHAHAFAAIGYIATILLNNSFLELKKYLPLSKRFFDVLILSWIIILFISLWDTRHITNRIVHILVLITSLMTFYTSVSIIKVKKHRRNDTFIIFYILAWIPISLVSIYVALALIDIIPLQQKTLRIINVAGIIEGIFVSLALLGDRIYLLRRDKERAEQKSLKLIEERNTYLEKKVRQHTKELQEANHALKESNDFKTKLLSIIAHDLKSPLSSLIMLLQAAKRIDSENLFKLLENVKKSTERVQRTLDNLLNWSISQMNMQYYKPCIIVIHSFLGEHMAIYEHLAQNKNIKYKLDCPEHIHIYADKHQLSLVVRNLIDNAIKFTPQNGIVSISAKMCNTVVELYISNTGQAIPQDTIDRILSSKTTLGKSFGTSREEGTGLGLQLCKEFIKNLNSELKITSKKDKETAITIFSFEIPLPTQSV